MATQVQGSAPNLSLIYPERLTWSRLAPVARAGRVAAYVAAFAVTWVALLDFGLGGAGASADAGYAVAYGHILKHELQAGVDYIFTYGPLGYFVHPAYDADLYWYAFAWEVAAKLIFTAVLFAVCRRYSSLAARILLPLAVVPFAHWIGDALYAFLITALGVLAVGSLRTSRLGLAGVGLALAVVALGKFTFLVCTVAAVGLITATLLVRGPRRRTLLPGAAYAAGFVALWWALGQQLGHLPRFLRTSWQVASGYVEAMALPGSRLEVYLALGVVALLGLALLAHPPRRLVRPEHLAAVLLVGLMLFVQWKHGFVRHDTHSLSFFDYAFLTGLTLPALLPGLGWRRPAKAIVLGYAVLLSAAGMFGATGQGLDPSQVARSGGKHLRANVLALIHPAERKGQLDRDVAVMETELNLPLVRAAVGHAPVDLLSYSQGLVFLNHLNWHPRPVLQSYSAYTPPLLEANARFFREEGAPEYVLFRFEAIDNRLPSEEDSLALVEILHRYRPVLAEKGYLLFRRRADVTGLAAATPLRQQTVGLNEDVALGDLPNVPQWVRLDLRYSSEGRVRKLLYKPPCLSLNVRTADNQVVTRRLIPGIAAAGFLLNPLLEDNADLIHLCAGAPGKRVVAFSVAADPKAARSFEPEVGVTVEGLPGLTEPRVAGAELERLLYAMMATPPAAVRSSAPLERRTCDGEDVLLVHPDGALDFPVAAGTHRVIGRFGILPGAYTEGRTDGVEFVAEFVPAHGAARVLFDRHLDPVGNAADRGTQALAVEGRFESAGVVRLRTANLPGHNTAWDWSYWTAVKVE